MNVAPSWKALAAAGPLLAAGSLLFSGWAYTSIQGQREVRVDDNARAALVLCEKGNEQDVRDREQDAELLGLVNVSLATGVLDPVAAARFREARRVIRNRLGEPPPLKCEQLQSQRPFRTSLE